MHCKFTVFRKNGTVRFSLPYQTVDNWTSFIFGHVKFDIQIIFWNTQKMTRKFIHSELLRPKIGNSWFVCNHDYVNFLKYLIFIATACMCIYGIYTVYSQVYNTNIAIYGVIFEINDITHTCFEWMQFMFKHI